MKNEKSQERKVSFAARTNPEYTTTSQGFTNTPIKQQQFFLEKYMYMYICISLRDIYISNTYFSSSSISFGVIFSFIKKPNEFAVCRHFTVSTSKRKKKRSSEREPKKPLCVLKKAKCTKKKLESSKPIGQRNETTWKKKIINDVIASKHPSELELLLYVNNGATNKFEIGKSKKITRKSLKLKKISWIRFKPKNKVLTTTYLMTSI